MTGKLSQIRILIDKKIYTMFVFDLLSDFDDCSSSPCKNGGTCIDGVNQFTCQCKRGFSGVNCEDRISKYLNTPTRQSCY